MNHKNYKEKRKKSSEFKSRKEYLEHELSILNFRKWRINLPFRDYSIEIEDIAPGIAATIGKVVMVTAIVAALASQFGLSPEFVAENVRFELLIAGGFFVILFSAILNPNANLSGTHGPMLPLIPIIAAAGGHPLALGILIGVFGIALSITKGGSKLMNLTGIGVRGGLLIYLGAMGLLSQIDKLEGWAANAGQSTISFVIIGLIILIYAYLARIGKRWVAIPLCSTIAGLVAYFMGAHFEFTTAPGLPHMNPMWWWGETTGWQMGWPKIEHYIAVIPFAILAVVMWSPDFLGHRVFQEINYPKGSEKVLMDVDDTMSIASVRQIVGSFLGGGNIASSWGTYMIPAAIAKRPIPGGALITAILCVLASVFGYPMDLAMWEPVLRVALIVGVFLPLLEAGMQMVKKQKDSVSAGTCIFACAFVNPVFGWALAMLLDNMGLIGDRERAKGMSWKEKLVIPGVMFVVCVVSLALAGQLPGIPRLL
ncbi:hypothetical protein AXE80_05300 [Wenyingzhuangia fucanilytica]|uniref:DUF3360 domain-containing protein n=1 Tax=Wenyingzhuangia fucanilytica TaxID=1790137 RepID=A0A1B1Y4R4_9FLAO|nr:DUF3360 family protein [Wenyingzhuangia fucanilytica]ANW95727.1 hypothetical protein AXE80_05300 [Wenyingzhuangia fucanilytica]